MRALRPGDVIAVPGGRRAGLAVVLDPGLDPGAEPRPLVLSEDRWAGPAVHRRLPGPGRAAGPDAAAQAGRPPRPAGAPRPGVRAAQHRHPGAGAAAPAAAAAGPAEDAELATLRRALRAHPCHGCADREAHARWAERHARLERETEQLRQKVRATTHSLARAFDRIRALLGERGYLDGERVTGDGRRLARLWGESDLLAAECLRHGVWDGLAPAELAAVVSALVYESRRENGPVPRVPAGAVSEALAGTVRIWAELESDERRHQVDRTREPDLGFAWPVHRWARGESLAAVLTAAEQNGSELSAGDFVRWCRQVVDLLDQIAAVAGRADGVGRAAAEAVARRASRRGGCGQRMIRFDWLPKMQVSGEPPELRTNGGRRSAGPLGLVSPMRLCTTSDGCAWIAGTWWNEEGLR